ncbi:MAG: methyltransferase family protein, partial [Desulfovibrionales bacterium]
MSVDLWECALGFMDAQMLMTAEELGVFTLLDKHPLSAFHIARELDLDEDKLERLLHALCSLRILKKGSGGQFCNGPEASKHLVRGRSGYIGSMFRHLREDLYPKWGQFAQIIQPNRTGSRSRANDPVQEFMDGMFEITYHAGREFAEKTPEISEVDHAVDVGGASGALLIAMAEKNDGLRGTVCDLSHVRELAENNFQRHGLQHRLDFQVTDFFRD